MSHEEAKTFREDLLDRFRQRLEAIQTVNGYHTDAGLALYIDEVPALGNDDPPAAIAITVGEDDVTYNVNEKLLVELPVEVSAIVRVDISNGWRLRERVLNDIKRAVETSDRRFANGTNPQTYLLTAEFKRQTTKSLRREAGASVMGSSVTYLVTYAEPWGGHLQVTA